jgi:hypothetical protein
MHTYRNQALLAAAVAGWFVLHRFYGPTEKLYDRSWVLGDFEKVR